MMGKLQSYSANTCIFILSITYLNKCQKKKKNPTKLWILLCLQSKPEVKHVYPRRDTLLFIIKMVEFCTATKWYLF